MKSKKVFLCAASAVAALAVTAAPDWAALNEQARRESLTVVHPGVPGKTPFWNIKSKAFIHPPAFDFKAVEGAAKYRFTVTEKAGGKTHVFTADNPWAALTPVWGDIPPGYVSVKAVGIDANGRELGEAGTRETYRAAFFKGPYPSGTGDYADAAKRCYAAVYRLPCVQGWLKQDTPPEGYDLYCYPSKILSSMIQALLTFAEEAPATDAEQAVAISRKMADWLIAQSLPGDSPLAHLPPTYWGDRRGVAVRNAGQNMLLYPIHAALAYHRLFEKTNEKRYRTAFLDIAATMRRLQGEDGTWWLKVREKDGSPVRQNRIVPEGRFQEMFEKAAALTGDKGYLDCANRARAYVERTTFATWNWDGQFEDMDPMPPYHDMEKQKACDFAVWLFGEKRMGEARELLAWCEDQFVVWSDPIHNMDWKNWKMPTALEQYDYYTPIDASMADFIGAFTAAYRATGDALYLEKAKALADCVTRHQRADGTIPTYFDSRKGSDWVNCMVYTAVRLQALDDELQRRVEVGRPLRSPASDLVIAARGKAPKYDIVIPAKPTVWQRHAASELRKWTKELTGVELAICEGKGEAPCHVRLIEPEPHLALGDEGFNLRTEKSDVVVRGGRRGMLYGVNELLETYGGIGWFSPWRTVVPKTGVLKVPDSLYDTQRPAFEMRYTDFYWCGDNDWSGQNVEPKREFFVHCRQNGAFKIRLQEKYGGFADAGLFVGGAGLCHTFLRLVPPANYFKDHPEYYSEIGGVRRNGETQLCLTNPDVLEIMVSNLVVKIDADPQAKFYGVSQADWENYCTCAKCRAVDEEEGSHAGTLIRFVNAVAARVEKIRPGLTCETLAYQYTRKPPKKTRPAKNVAICFCNIECDHSLPLSAAGTATNEAFLDDFVAWSALTDNLYFWDYITNFRWSFHAFPNLNSMQQNVKFFRDHGVRWLFEEGTCMHADFFALKCWLVSKWMWNPDLPAEPLLQRFFEGYYGPAAPYARAVSDKFTLALANAPINPRRLGIFENDRPNVYTDSLLNEALALWREGERAAKDDPGALANVQSGKAGTIATILDRAAATSKNVWATRHPEKFDTFEKVSGLYAEMLDWIAKEQCLHPKTGIAFGYTNPTSTWKHASRSRRPAKGSDCAFAGPDDVLVSHPGSWGRLVDDPAATGGRAAMALPVQPRPCITLFFNNVAYDPDVDYRVRAHVRVEKVPGGKGEAFQALVNVVDGKPKLDIGPKAEDISSEGYEWYDLGTFRPAPGDIFEFGSGRFTNGGGHGAIKAVYLDRIEISRVGK